MDISLLKIPLKNRLEVVQLERATSAVEIDAQVILGMISGFVLMIFFVMILV